MIDRTIIARGITNLTDARYFAARGIEYLLFDLDEIPIKKIEEIKEWVEGPELLLTFSESSLHLIEESIIKLEPAGLGVPNPDLQKSIEHLSAYTKLFDMSKDEVHFADTRFYQVDKINDINSLDSEAGILISGSHESEVGVKSFDELDELLDYLEESN